MSKLKHYKMYIDGEWIDSESKKTFETLNPENNEPWATVPEASAKDVDKAVKAAQKAFEGEWPKLLPRDRAKFLRAIVRCAISFGADILLISNSGDIQSDSMSE